MQKLSDDLLRTMWAQDPAPIICCYRKEDGILEAAGEHHQRALDLWRAVEGSHDFDGAEPLIVILPESMRDL